MAEKSKTNWKVGRLYKKDALFYVHNGKKIRVAMLDFAPETKMAIVKPCQKSISWLFRYIESPFKRVIRDD